MWAWQGRRSYTVCLLLIQKESESTLPPPPSPLCLYIELPSWNDIYMYCDLACWNDTCVPNPLDRIRLTNRTAPGEGVVEIFDNGKWGRICDDEIIHFERANTECRGREVPGEIICRQLGFESFERYFSSEDGENVAQFGELAEILPLHINQICCFGNEDSLLQCPHFNSPCSPGTPETEFIGIRCTGRFYLTRNSFQHYKDHDVIGVKK